MTEKKATTKRDPEARIQKLREQQAELSAQIKAQKKKLRDREEKRLNDRRIEIGRLAESAGVLFASDDALLAALRTIASGSDTPAATAT